MLRTALLFLAVTSTAWAQPVLFVDADATGTADGSSWADAFPDLQQALTVAAAGDEIWVAEGTYRPTDGADRDASFVLVSGVGLYGGFDGTETALDERDPEANVTGLSGDLGVPDEISDNAYHVVTASGVDSTTVLDGFTVTGGYGNGANPRNRGGGIYAENSSLVVRNARIVANAVVQTDGFGGGSGAFFGTTGSPRFERVVFERNGVGSAIGGGLWLFVDVTGADASAEAPEEALVREALRERRREAPGGSPGSIPGEEGTDLRAALFDVVFAENAARFGGGIHSTNADLVLVRVVFVRNVVASAGGGLWISGATGHPAEGQLVDVSFYGNVVREDDGDGSSFNGGLYGSFSPLSLVNVAFVGNTARLGGGLGLSSGGMGVLTNVTFAANEAEQGGGLQVTSGAEAAVQNTILWGDAGGEIFLPSGTATLIYTLVAGGCPPGSTCESLLDVDPLFVRAPSPGPDGTWGTADDDYGDLRLQDGSPAVDFGETSFLPPDTFDLDADGDTEEPLPLDLAGEPRVQGEAVDLGAYEHPGPVANEPEPATAPVLVEVYPNPARGPVTVTLALSRSQRVEITVYDLRGRRVATLHDGPLAAGPHALRLATASLPAGVYFVHVGGAAGSLTRRFVVLR